MALNLILLINFAYEYGEIEVDAEYFDLHFICFQPVFQLICFPDADETPEITELENGGLCDVRYGVCSSVRVLGQGFKKSYKLKCEIVKEKVTNHRSIELKHQIWHKYKYYQLEYILFCLHRQQMVNGLWMMLDWCPPPSRVLPHQSASSLWMTHNPPPLLTNQSYAGKSK